MNAIDDLRHILIGNQGTGQSGSRIPDYQDIREARRRKSLNLMPCFPYIHYLIP